MKIPESIAIVYGNTLVFWEYAYDDNYAYTIQKNWKLNRKMIITVAIAKTKRSNELDKFLKIK